MILFVCFSLYKVIGLVGEGSVINGAHPVEYFFNEYLLTDVVTLSFTF